MTDKELKPCPNCGGQPKIHKTHKKFYVECDGDCWTQTGKHSYQEDAVKEWNTQIAVAKEGRQMTDHKFTDDEIIKALECCNECNCKQCPCFAEDVNGCKEIPTDQILALINRQKAEIERMKELLEGWKKEAYKVADEKDEIYCNAIERVKTAKAEAIKEFAERAKEKMQCLARTEYGNDQIYFLIGELFIDNLVKEMMEEIK